MILKNIASLHAIQNNTVNKLVKELEKIKVHSLPYQSPIMKALIKPPYERMKMSEYKLENMVPSFAQNTIRLMDTMEKAQHLAVPSMFQGLALANTIKDFPAILGSHHSLLKGLSSAQTSAKYLRELKAPLLTLRHLQSNLMTSHALALDIYPKRFVGLLDVFKYKPIPEEYFIESEAVLRRVDKIKKMHRHETPATVRGYIQKTFHMSFEYMKYRVRECTPHRANDFDFVNTEFITAFYLALSAFNKASFRQIIEEPSLRKWFRSKINHYFRKNLLADAESFSRKYVEFSSEHESAVPSTEAGDPIDKEAIWKAFYEKVGPKQSSANIGREKVLELILSGDFEKLAEITKRCHEYGFKEGHPKFVREFLQDYALTIWPPKPAMN